MLGRVNVAGRELGVRRLVGEAGEHPAGAAAEVEDAATVPVPVRRQATVDAGADLAPDLVPMSPRVDRVELADTAREPQRWPGINYDPPVNDTNASQAGFGVSDASVEEPGVRAPGALVGSLASRHEYHVTPSMSNARRWARK